VTHDCNEKKQIRLNMNGSSYHQCMSSIPFKYYSLRSMSSNNSVSRLFSSDARSDLMNTLEREIEEEETNNTYDMPEELIELKSLVEKKWRIQEVSGSTFRLYGKEPGHQGSKVMIEFHCQDTVENNDSFGDEDNSEEVEEDSAGLRFKVVFNRSGKRLIFFCTSEHAEFKLNNVMFSNEDGIEEEAYRGPALSELDEELYECLAVFLRDDCGINENVAAFIAMYSDFCEQREYTNWLNSIKSIIE